MISTLNVDEEPFREVKQKSGMHIYQAVGGKNKVRKKRGGKREGKKKKERMEKNRGKRNGKVSGGR